MLRLEIRDWRLTRRANLSGANGGDALALHPDGLIPPGAAWGGIIQNITVFDQECHIGNVAWTIVDYEG